MRLQGFRLLRDERGFSLFESLIGAMLVAVALNVILLALSTGSLATSRSSQRVTAQAVARSHMEHVKAQPYAGTYQVSNSLLPDASWSATVTATQVITNLQKIQVSVSQSGSQQLVLEGIKANR